MFCSQVMAWAPALLFTLLNEAGVPQRVGLATLCIFFLGALGSYCMMGEYSEAVRVAGRLDIDTIPSAPQLPTKPRTDTANESEMPLSDSEE